MLTLNSERRFRGLQSVSAGLAMLVLGAGVAAAQTFGFATMQPGTLNHTSGTAVAKVLKEKAGLNVVVQPTAGESVLIPLVSRGEAEFGIANILEVEAAKASSPNLRLIGSLHTLRGAFWVRKDSNMKTMADLKGKRVGMGYSATGDVSLSGIQRAAEQARGWAMQSAGRSVVDFSKMRTAPPTGEYATHELFPWRHTPLSDKIDLLRAECARLKTDDRIVDWEASLWYTETDTLYLTTDGGRVYQHFVYLVPMLSATANAGSETQSRTFGGRGHCRQGGMEVLDAVGFRSAAPQLAAEALQLLTAPNCPSEVMDVLLAPDQMILQIHESVGHPLELDRILGDERNYAGTSFVTPDMFGTYRYGSDLLNITFDPTRPEQYVSYGFDDDGQRSGPELAG